MEHILTRNSGINKIIGACALSLICFYMFLGNIEKIAKANSIIIPILILFILFFGIKNLFNINIEDIGINTKINRGLTWIIYAFLYSSYNLILLVPVLINLKNFIKSRRQILFISILTGIIITTISILIFLLLINVDIDFSKLEMPIVYVMKSKFNQVSTIYGIIILIAILTTAVSVGISFLNNFCKNKKNFPHVAAIMCIAGVVMSNIGFSNLVKTIFPMFGCLGIVQVYHINKKN